MKRNVRQVVMILLVMVLSYGSSCLSQAYATTFFTATIQSAADAEGAFIYNDVTPDRREIGHLFNGTLVEIVIKNEMWSYVKLSDSKTTIEGWINNADLLFETDVLQPSLLIRIGEVTCPSGAKLLELPQEQSLILDKLMANMRVKVIGLYDEFYIVEICGRYGFVLQDEIRIFPDAVFSSVGGGVPTIGFLVLKETSSASIKDFSSISPERENTLSFQQYSSASSPLEIVANLDQWYQVRKINDATDYFVSKSNVQETYFLSEWLCNKDNSEKDRHFGKYQNAHSGLYTYVLENGQSGALTIHSSDSAYNYDMSFYGPTSFTVYIPENANVEIHGDGYLDNTLKSFEALSDNFQYQGNASFFVGLQFPRYSHSRVGVIYRFRGIVNEHSIVVIRNIDGSVCEKHTLCDEAMVEMNNILINDSKFVEIHNCFFEIEFSSNG